MVLGQWPTCSVGWINTAFVNWIFIPGVVVRKYVMHLKVASNWHNGMKMFSRGWQFGVVWWWIRVV